MDLRDASLYLTDLLYPSRVLTRCIKPKPTRAKRAARAGFVTLLVGWLALALFFAPYWASQTNFPGHHHPSSVPPHTHTVQAVLGHAVVVAAVVAVFFMLQTFGSLLLAPVLWLERTIPKKAHGSRAPPSPL